MTNLPVPGPGGAERRAAARGVAWSGLESGVTAAVGFLLTPLIVRFVGIEGLGLWSASWSMAHTSGLLDLGVGGSYARFTSRALATGDTVALNRFVGAGVGFHLALSLLVAATAMAFGPACLERIAPNGPLAAGAPLMFGCILGVVLLRLTFSAYRGVLAGAQRIDLLGRIGAGAALVEGGGAAVILLSGGGLRGMAVNSLTAGLLQTVAEGVGAHRLCPGLRIRPFGARRSDWREILSFGLRLQATRAAEILGAHAPRLALAGGPGLLAAGIYDLGARVAGGLQVVGALPLPVIQPLSARLEARGDRHRLRILVARSTRYVALLVFPATAVLLLDAPAILAAWTGRDVPAGAAACVRWMSAAVAVGLLASPLRLVLRGLGRPGTEAVAVLSGSTLNLGLAIALAARFGAGGVAAAALAGALLTAAVLGAGARRHAGNRLAEPVRDLLPLLLAGLAALLAGIGLQVWLPVAAPAMGTRLAALFRLLPEAGLVGAAFLLGAFVSGGLKRDDFELLRDIVPPRASARSRGVVGGAP